MKIARVSELQKIAQDLGAKHFRVTYKEEKATLSEKKGNAKLNMKPIASADMEYSCEEKKYSTIDIAAKMDFSGHDPIRATLKYLRMILV